jgi:molybdenum cofactor cytidylyltransferase
MASCLYIRVADMSLAIVPAAGRAERFGSAKLLADLDGEPLLARTIRSLLEGGVERVVVVVAPGSAVLDLREPREVFGSPAVELVVNPDPDRGMFSSIQAGLAGHDTHDTLLVLPADMPFVKPATVGAVLAAVKAGDAIVLPTVAGSHGHPIGLPALLAPRLRSADPRSSLKQVLASTGHEHRELPVADAGILRDVDLPRDLER